MPPASTQQGPTVLIVSVPSLVALLIPLRLAGHTHLPLGQTHRMGQGASSGSARLRPPHPPPPPGPAHTFPPHQALPLLVTGPWGGQVSPQDTQSSARCAAWAPCPELLWPFAQ